MHAVFDSEVADVVGRPMMTGFDAAAGHPDCVTVRVVIAAEFGWRSAGLKPVCGQLGRPDDQRIFQKASGLEIAQQTGDRLIDFGRLFVVLLEEIGVLIPFVAVGALNVADIAFGEAPRQ